MATIINDWCRACDKCRRFKTPMQQSNTPLQPMPSTATPFQRMAIDFMILPTTSRGYSKLLVCVDYATRFAVAVPTKDETVETTARVIYNEIISKFGPPQTLLSDRGANFRSELMTELCKLVNTKQVFTTPYHPQCDGLVERLNATLQKSLAMYGERFENDWDLHINAVVHAYNCAKQTSTGYAPYYLMYGREPKQPIDLSLGITEVSKHIRGCCIECGNDPLAIEGSV